TARPSASALAKRRRELGAGIPHGWNHAAPHGDERRDDERECPRRPVDAHFGESRQLRRASAYQRADPDRRHREANRTGQRGKNRGFREEILNQATAPGAEGGTHRELAVAGV